MSTYADLYDEDLDAGELVEIAGYSYPVSLALSRVDPVAYRCGFCDWLDSLDVAGCGACGDSFSPDTDAIENTNAVECPECARERA